MLERLVTRDVLMEYALSKVEEERQATLHEKATVILSCDWPDVIKDEYFRNMIQGGITGICWTVGQDGANASETIKKIAGIYKLVDEKCDILSLATTVEDIDKAKNEGKLAIILAFQSPAPLEIDIFPPFAPDLGLLKVYHKLGARIVQLAGNSRSVLADGCTEPTDSGLSIRGRRVVEEMNHLGMLIDLAHVGKRSSLDAIELSRDPVIFSHSNPHTRVPVTQNHIDEELKAMAEKGGVIGLTAFPRMLNVNPDKASLEDLLGHIDYVEKLVGIDYVGLGLHINEGRYEDPMMVNFFMKCDGRLYTFPKELDTYAKLPNIVRGLISRGYSDYEIGKVLGGNIYRVFKKVFS